MNFTGKEKQAIMKMSIAMASADGKVDAQEILMNRVLAMMIRPTREDVEAESTLSFDNAISILSAMSPDKKEFVSACLGAMMQVDGHIDETELVLWKLVSTLCSFPEMNVLTATTKFKRILEEAQNEL